MNDTITKSLNNIKELIQEKQFEQALLRIENIDKSSLSKRDYAYYCLLASEAKLWVGDYRIKDDIDKAINYFMKSNENETYAHAKYILGRYLIYVGDLANAQENLLESYLYFKRYNNLDSAQRALNFLAFVQHTTGATADAIKNLEACIEINDSMGKVGNVITLFRNLALVQFKSGAIKSALSQYNRIGKYSVQMSDNEYAQTYLTFAIINAFKGNLKNSSELINRVVSYPGIYKREQAIYYEYLGWIYNLDGQYIKAVATLKTGLELSMKIAPESDHISQTKRLLADAYLGLRKYDEAKTTAEEALAVAEKINERVEIAACYRVLAQVAQQRRAVQTAHEWYKKAVDIFKLIQSRYELAATQVLMAESGLYDVHERNALLYMAKEYFEAEEIEPYIKRIDALTAKQPPSGGNGSGKKNGSAAFIAVHPATKKIVEMARHIAGCNMTVLLTGPTGSGKDHLAKLIHEYSGRKGEFVLINCAAVPDTMVEAELFGYAKGAFTSADRDKIGLVEHADGGTVYLNEIGDCSPAFQAKLLEVIETCQVRRLGATDSKTVNVRFIAATCHDLKELISDGRFRLDLYHRLNEIPIILPPLDERRQDIAELTRCFLKELKPDVDPQSDDPDFRRLCDWLEMQAWPGNVRQLKAKVNWLFQISEGDLKAMSEHVARQELSEREMMRKALEETGWNRSETARRLGLTEETVRRRIAKHNLDG